MRVRFSKSGLSRNPRASLRWNSVFTAKERSVLAAVECEEIGLPGTYNALLAHSSPPRFRFPKDAIEFLATRIHERHPRGEPLWISLDSPRRMTALAPWERLFEPLGVAPLFRAPQLPLLPVAPIHRYRVAFCANLTTGRGLGDLASAVVLLGQILKREHAWQSIRVDVFLHLGVEVEFPVIDSILSLLGGIADVTYYGPIDRYVNVPSPIAGEMGRAADVRHPWLRWIKSRLDGQGVDRLVMVSDARLFPGRAALALNFWNHREIEESSLVRCRGTRSFRDHPRSLPD